MELIIEPKDGLVPLVSAIKKATKQIDVTIFRFDLRELQRALESAVTRGVKVHALIAHTSGSGEKRLRKLELELLHDLYHGDHSPKHIIFLRDLYELLERVIDRCRDAGNVILQIVLKYA